MIRLTDARIDRCERCQMMRKGFTYQYDPVGIPAFRCLPCLNARLDDCLLAVFAVRSDMAAHAELTRADVARLMTNPGVKFNFTLQQPELNMAEKRQCRRCQQAKLCTKVDDRWLCAPCRKAHKENVGRLHEFAFICNTGRVPKKS